MPAPAPPIFLISQPYYTWLPGGGTAVGVSLECASVRVDILFVIYPHTYRILRRYSRKVWSL